MNSRKLLIATKLKVVPILHQENEILRKTFSFSDTDILQEYYIKRLIYKIEKEKLPLLDIVSKIEDATKNKYRSIYGK